MSLLGVLFVASALIRVSKGEGILYPRESETRQVTLLDGVWQFRISNNTRQGFKEKWFRDSLKKIGGTIPMPVPSSYNDITQEAWIRDFVGPVWYERTFFVPKCWKHQKFKVWLRFGSAHYSTKVWVNGEEVMSHEIGHLPFEDEITQVLKYGKENRLTVTVDNTLSSTTIPQGRKTTINTINGKKDVLQYAFDFFNYAGIHRHVHLYTTPGLFISDLDINTDLSPDLDKGLVNYNVTLGGDPIVNVNCVAIVKDADGNIVAEENGFTGQVIVDQVKLWWPYLMNPNPGYMYNLEVKLMTEKDELYDIYRQPFGFRSITWNSSTVLINQKPIYLRGFGRHEDSDIRGKGLDMPLVTKDYNLLNWIGANSYRTSHYPYAEEIMDFADKQGIMIIDECPSVDTDIFSSDLLKNHKKSLSQLIKRDKNRPSVVMWSVSNEPRSQKNASDSYFKSVVKHVKTLDKSRPITAAIAQQYNKDHLAQYLDVIAFNRYNGWYSDPGQIDVIVPKVIAEVHNWCKKFKKPVFMSEYGADTMQGLHLMPEYIWSEEYQTQLLSEHFKAFDTLRKEGCFVGEMLWNFADFNTAQTYTRVGGNKKGIFTRERQPKSAAHVLRQRYFELANILDNAPLPSDLKAYVAS